MTLRILPILLCVTGMAFAGDPNRTETRTEPLAMGAKLWVKQGDGKIDIKGWDKAEVQLVAKFEEGTNHEEAQLEVRHVAEGLEIEVKRERNHFRFLFIGHFRTPKCHLTLMVPRKLSMDLRSVDGAISVQDLEGYAGCHTVDGNIFLRAISGDVHAKAVDGAITAQDLRARIKGGTVDGAITLDHVEGGVDLHTVDGSITARDLDGWGEGISLRTVDGNIVVRLGQAKGNLEAKAVDGRIRCQLPGLTYHGNGSNHMTGQVPGRDQQLAFRTVDGNIDIE